MVGNYKRISLRQSWDEAAMQRAVNAVNSGQMGWLRAATTFGVPQATLRRRARDKNKTIRGVMKGLGRFVSTFGEDLERELVSHLKLLESRLFGLNTTEVRQLAYQLAESKGIDHRFNHETKMAGWDWLKGFRKRNPDIGLRKPEPTSAARAMGFNKPQVSKFFEVYEEVLLKHKITPSKIFNMDESSLSTVQKPPKVFAKVGKKQVGAITSAERGMHVTVVCCMNPTGQYVPPALIFPRKNWKSELIDGAPVGSIGIAQETGWMTGEVFLRWLNHFASFVKPTIENKVLLIVDGHSSHKQLDVVVYAKENGIVMLCLPPHCTHRLQPLDIAFYGPLKSYYDQEVRKWMKTNPGRTVGQYQISSLFSVAYGKAGTIANAESGFRKTGIWPINPDIFEDHLFAPAETTNVPKSPHEKNNSPSNGLTVVEPTTSGQFSTNVTESSLPLAYPSTSGLNQDMVSNQQKNLQGTYQQGVSTSVVENVSVADLSPVPLASRLNKKRRVRKHHGSIVLTSSPFLTELQKRAEDKKQKELRKSSRSAKRRLDLDTEDVYEEELLPDNDDEDCPCLYCNELYSLSRPGESWLQCMNCKLWAHCECAGLSKNSKIFICDVCKQS